MDENSNQSELEIASDLVDRVCNGDLLAETEMVERYSRGLRFLLRRKTADTDQVEDFLQETWIIALTKIRSEGLENPDRLAGYLCGIANNLLRSDVRRVNRQRTTVDTEIINLVPDESDNLFRQFKLAEKAKLAHGTLSKLSRERDRDILRSFYINEEDKDSICGRLGIDGTHFNRVLHRARIRMRKELQSIAARRNFHVVG